MPLQSPCGLRPSCVRAVLAAAFVLAVAAPARAQLFAVSDEGELREAIFQVSNDFANGVNNAPYSISLLADITLTQSLPMIRALDAVPDEAEAQVTIDGNGFTINANNT